MKKLMTDQQLALCAALRAANVQYAVVGGVAVNAYGYVRQTRDLDLFLRPTPDNARSAFQVLLEEGIELDGYTWEDLLCDEDHIRFGEVMEKVDVLNSIGSMAFDQVWRNRNEVNVRGVDVSLISKKDLIENKQQVGRLRDLNDVEELLARKDDEPDATKL